jgi:SHS2 domain-containing protein
MDSKPASGYREIDHTADWELEIWAPDLAELLEQAARGMYHLTGIKASSEMPRSHILTLQFDEPETLLVDFLNELLYRIESEDLVYNQFDLQIEAGMLNAALSGVKINSFAKEIKAATYHQLAIKETDQGLLTRIVFDV